MATSTAGRRSMPSGATGETARTAERAAAAMLLQNISSVFPAITRAHVRTVSAIFAVTARRGCTGTGS